MKKNSEGFKGLVNKNVMQEIRTGGYGFMLPGPWKSAER